MGLRVPLFFGEISVNGSSPVGGSTGPQPPLISCTGALNITDPIDMSGDWKLEIDGVLVLPEATEFDDVIAYLNEHGFDVEIEQPQINCAEARYDVIYVKYERIGSDIPEGSEKAVIDGVTYNFGDSFPLWFEAQNVEYPVMPPSGFVNAGAYRLVNNDSLNHRVEILSTSDDLQVDLFENPSVVVIEPTKRIGACLSPAPR